jgi:hypothetical protein
LRIPRWLAWIGWYLAAGVVVSAWTVLSAFPYVLVNGAMQLVLAGRNAPAVLAWLTLPLLLGLWPYLLLRFTARQAGLNGGIFWVYVVSLVVTVCTVIAAAVGLEHDLHAYKLFGFDPVSHGVGVWAAWTLLAAFSGAAALVVYRVQTRERTHEPDVDSGHG